MSVTLTICLWASVYTVFSSVQAHFWVFALRVWKICVFEADCKVFVFWKSEEQKKCLELLQCMNTSNFLHKAGIMQKQQNGIGIHNYRNELNWDCELLSWWEPLNTVCCCLNIMITIMKMLKSHKARKQKTLMCSVIKKTFFSSK